jgi:hypothetical protein
MRLNGVSAARLKLEKPAFWKTSAKRRSPACAPNAAPFSSERECAQQIVAEAE